MAGKKAPKKTAKPIEFVFVEVGSDSQTSPIPLEFFGGRFSSRIRTIGKLKPGDTIKYIGNGIKKCPTRRTLETKANSELVKGQKYKILKFGSAGKDPIVAHTD